MCVVKTTSGLGFVGVLWLAKVQARAGPENKRKLNKNKDVVLITKIFSDMKY